MSFAFMPVYTGDYLRDTRHLTPLKHGIYLMLLMHCWDTKGPLPTDEQECAGLANCRSADEVEALRYVLARFFVRMADGWYNKRMQIEVERAENISRVRSEVGRKGYEARARTLQKEAQAIAKQLPSNCNALASTPTPTPTLTPTPNTKQLPLVGLKPDHAQDGTSKTRQLRDAAVRILDVLNRNAGRRYEPVSANITPIVARLREGYSERELCAIAAVKARQWRSDDTMEKYIRPKTLYNATNAANYRAELPSSQLDRATNA